MVKTLSVFRNRILIMLAFLFVTTFANFCFCLTVAAYPYNTKINGTSYLYGSRSAIGSPDTNNNLLTLHNITNTVSFTGEVNVSNLPSLPSSKPGVFIDPEEQYLTRNYTSYINAKKQAELLRPANTPTTKVIEIQRTDLPLLVSNSSNNNNSTSATINTHFEGLSQLCCIPPDIRLAVGSKHIMETVNSEAAIYTKTGSLIKKFGLEFMFNLPSRESSDSHSITDPVLLFDNTTNYTRSDSHIDGNNDNDNRRWFASKLVKNNNNIFDSLKYFQFLKNGTSNSLSTRYGDYFSAVMDPSETNSIWVAGQYYYYSPSSSGVLWSTYIGKINMGR